MDEKILERKVYYIMEIMDRAHALRCPYPFNEGVQCPGYPGKLCRFNDWNRSRGSCQHFQEYSKKAIAKILTRE